MLVKFEVSNFNSILEPITIDFTDYKAEIPYFRKSEFNECMGRHKINGKEYSFIKGLYSKSVGGGKTNVLKALSFFFDFIHNSYKSDENAPIDVHHNIFTDKEDTSFKAEFLLGKKRLSYELTLNEKQIVHEKLERDGSLVFERKGDNVQTKNKSYVKLKKLVRKNVAFISTAYENDVKTHMLDNVCMNHIDLYVSREEELKEVISEIGKSAYIRGNISNLISKCDFGIESFEVREFPSINENSKEIINYIPYANHGNGIMFPLESESSGTLNFIIFMTKFLKAAMNGGIVLIDNIERNFHQILVENILEFMERYIEGNKDIQVIFSSSRHLIFLDFLSPKDNYFCSIEEGSQKVVPVSSMECFEKGYKKHHSFYRASCKMD